MSNEFLLKFPNAKKQNTKKNYSESEIHVDSKAQNVNSSSLQNDLDFRKFNFLEESLRACLDYEKTENHRQFSLSLESIYKNFRILTSEISSLESQSKTFRESVRVNPEEDKEINRLREELIKIESETTQAHQEIAALQTQNEEYKQFLGKKDFFNEYDKKCKEVENYRKTNSKLLEQVKKLQALHSN